MRAKCDRIWVLLRKPNFKITKIIGKSKTKVCDKSYRLSEISDELAIESRIYFRLIISDCIPDLFGKKPKRTPLPNMKKPAKKGER